MIKKTKMSENFLLKKNLKNLNYYLKSYFSNLYFCYIKGIGYEVCKYQKKTEYRIENNLKELEFFLKKENCILMKSFFLNELFLLSKKKKKNKHLFKNDWIKERVLSYVYLLQEDYFIEILENIDKNEIDFTKIKKNLFVRVMDHRFDYQKILVKVRNNTVLTYKEKPITQRKQKKKARMPSSISK